MAAEFGGIKFIKKEKIIDIQEITLQSVTVETCSSLLHSTFLKIFSELLLLQETDLSYSTFTKLP